jgi:hypothetical protein
VGFVEMSVSEAWMMEARRIWADWIGVGGAGAKFNEPVMHGRGGWCQVVVRGFHGLGPWRPAGRHSVLGGAAWNQTKASTVT